MSKFKSSVAVYIDFINLMKSTFDKEIFSKFFDIEKEFLVPETPSHHFFVLRKK